MSSKKFVFGALLGAAVGATLGILFAPKSGKETREIINKKTKECVKKGKDLYDKEIERAKDFVDDKAKDAKKVIKEAADQVSEKMS